MGFIDEENYTKHMWDVEGIDITKGDNFLKCEKCPLTFVYAKTLKNHIKSCRKKDLVLKCEACSSMFYNQSVLQTHLKTCVPYKYLQLCYTETKIEMDQEKETADEAWVVQACPGPLSSPSNY